MITAIIPSRFGSTRFYGKPLVLIAGKPMIQRVYEQAQKASVIDRVFVATDDRRIADAAEGFGCAAVMTSGDVRSGTDRVAEASDMLGLNDNDIVVNIQGDQPVFNPRCLNELVSPFMDAQTDVCDFGMSTLAYKIRNKREITDPKDVKVAFDKNMFALYFSRAQIPFPRDGFSMDEKDNIKIDFYKHLGFYAYKKHFLDRITLFETTPLENTEKLEQLRVLENGCRIKVVVTEYDSPEVDIPEDIARIERKFLNMHQ